MADDRISSAVAPIATLAVIGAGVGAALGGGGMGLALFASETALSSGSGLITILLGAALGSALGVMSAEIIEKKPESFVERVAKESTAVHSR